MTARRATQAPDHPSPRRTAPHGPLDLRGEQPTQHRVVRHVELAGVLLGAIGSAALMLEHSGLLDEAKAVQRAIEDTTGSGVRTRDVGGTATTDEVTAAIIENLAN